MWTNESTEFFESLEQAHLRVLKGWPEDDLDRLSLELGTDLINKWAGLPRETKETILSNWLALKDTDDKFGGEHTV